MALNRVVLVVLFVCGVVAAAAPALADMDYASTAGVIAGLGAAAAAVLKFVSGWQRYEEREFYGGPRPDDEP